MTRLEHLERMRTDCLKTIHEIMRSGQTVEIEGMRRTLPALDKVRAMLNDIENEMRRLQCVKSTGSVRPRIRVVVPL